MPFDIAEEAVGKALAATKATGHTKWWFCGAGHPHPKKRHADARDALDDVHRGSPPLREAYHDGQEGVT